MVFNYIVNVTATSNPFGALASSASVFENHLSSIDSGIQRMNSQMSQFGSRSNSAFGGASTNLQSLAAQVGATAAVMQSLGNAADEKSLENSILFAGGKNGADNLDFVKRKIQELKLPLEATMEGFKTLSGGLMGTGLTGLQTKEIFTGIAEASVVMGMKSEETKGALLALSQMASKGTVSAEELRGQLGERLPGAFGLAAQAMGVTQQQLGKMLENGEIMAKDFLPRFATQLHATFGNGLTTALQGARSNFNEFQNSLHKLSVTFGEQIMPTVTGFLNGYLIPSISFVGQHIGLFTSLGAALGGVWVASKLLTFWTVASSSAMSVAAGIQTFYNTALYFGGGAYGFYTAAKILATEATFAFTTALEAMNLAFLMSPIFWIPAAIIAVGAGIVWAWNKFETFRGVVMGVGYALKEFGSIIYDWVLKPIFGFGEVLLGVFTGNLDLIKKGIGDTADALSSAAGGFGAAGERIGNAFMKGYADGVGKAATGTQSVMETDALGKYYSQKDGDNKPVMGGSGAGGKKTKDKIDGINGGGRKVTTINIDLKNLVENFTLNANTVTEGAKDMQEIVLRQLLQVLNNANQIQLQ